MLKELVTKRALELGFDDVGVCGASPLEDGGRFGGWLASGCHGEMEYLERHVDQRLDPGLFFPGARSFVMVVKSYRPENLDVDDELEHARPIALYARGRDYHRVMKKGLKRLVGLLEAGGHRARVHVDTSAVMEKVLAVRCGLGVQGNHSLLVHPRFGSFVFLGGVVTDVRLEPDLPLPVGESPCCGCNRCVDACPTGALKGGGVLDARECLSYGSIESRGGLTPGLAGVARGRVFGCDLCQLACPANRAAACGRPEDFAPYRGAEAFSVEKLAALGEEQFGELFRGTAVGRVGWRRFTANCALASETA